MRLKLLSNSTLNEDVWKLNMTSGVKQNIEVSIFSGKKLGYHLKAALFTGACQILHKQLSSLSPKAWLLSL